ncbi:AaceriADL244Wp [[Ashbya] aceris (nom. inval.)]|nr:AaceriADL244Wp [[Ashbya] aceris (nom. inval.)]
MSDHDKQDGTGQVKKRSLSSYLLNVNARKAELENLAKHEKDGTKSACVGEDQNEAANAGGIGSSPNQQGSVSQQASEGRPAMPAINAEELEGGTAQELLAHSDKNAKAVSEDVTVTASTLETQKSARWQECGGENGTAEKEQDDPSEPHGTVMHAEGTVPGGDVSIVSDATGDVQVQQKSEVQDAVGPPIESQIIDSVTATAWAKNEEQESSLSEVDSDAPTEPASPPKPRLGRLVRGDQLSSVSSNAKWHTRPATTHDSDSELSDLADLKPVPLSSSILHGESSPTKAQSAVSSSPKKTLPHPAHSSYSKSSSATSKKMKHVAVSKIVKPRKGVHRDAGGRTRLQVACDKGKYDLARKLIEEGYDVNDQDNAGNSPLHEAALNGHLEVVKLLIRHGANVNIQSYEMFKDTPLIDASANGHLDVVRELLQHGADPTIVNAKGLTAIESIDDDTDLDEEEVQIVREIKALLRKAARKYKKEDGDAKQLPQRSKVKEGHSEDDDSIQSTAAFDKDFYWTDITSKLGKEKLFRASKEGRLAYVGAYLENGGHADFRSFMESVKFGHEDIASLFLAFGAQVNAVGRDGQTALMAAVGRGHLNTVKLLLEAGADPTKRDKDGHSVLYYAKHSPVGLVDEEELVKLKDAILENNGILSEEDKLCLDKDTGKTTPVDVKVEKQESPNQIKSSCNAKDKLPERAESPVHTTKVKPSKERVATSPTSHLSPKSERTREQTPMKTHLSEHEVASDDEKGVYSSSVKAKKRRIGSPSAAAASDDRSYRPATSEKARTASPNKLKRSVSAVSITSDTAESGTKRPKLESLSGAHSHQQETPEERDARLKREEQYKLKRLESKRKKEQEFLQKLADDERKRQEEKERAEQERRRQEEEERLRKTKQEQLLRDQQEIEKRIAIRDQYPLGLKLVDFQNRADYNRYLPVPYIVRDGARYLLDLHAAVLCKNPEISRAGTRAVPVSPENRPQLWNIYKFLFLYGGYGPGHYLVDFSHHSLEEQLHLEHQEYLRFVRIPLHWLPYDDIPWPSSELRTAVDASMRELQLLAPPHVAHAPLDVSRTPESVPSAPTPAKFRHRPAIAVWLSGVKSLW